MSTDASFAKTMITSLAVAALLLVVAAIVSLLFGGNTIQDAARALRLGLTTVYQTLQTALTALVEKSVQFSQAIQSAFRGAAEQAAQIGRYVVRYLKVVRQAVSQQLLFLSEQVEVAALRVGEFLTKTLVEQTRAMATKASQLATDVFTELFSIIGGGVNKGFRSVETAVAEGTAFLEGIWDTMQTFFVNLLQSSLGWLLGLMENIRDFVLFVIAWITGTAVTIVNACVDFANQIWDAVKTPFCFFCSFCRDVPFCSRPQACFDFC
jgi:hypothetical protein